MIFFNPAPSTCGRGEGEGGEGDPSRGSKGSSRKFAVIKTYSERTGGWWLSCHHVSQR